MKLTFLPFKHKNSFLVLKALFIKLSQNLSNYMGSVSSGKFWVVSIFFKYVKSF